MELLSWLWSKLGGERSEEEARAEESEYDNWFVEQALYEEGERNVEQGDKEAFKADRSSETEDVEEPC